MDKSYVLDVIDILRDRRNEKANVYAILAPSIAGQFQGVKYEQVVTGLHKLGFTHIAEAAVGADLVALAEGQELIDKGLLTSSCCPAFVGLIEKHYPELKKHVSHNMSPQATLARHFKLKDKNAKVVFIGPCMAKKAEIQREEEAKWTDAVITFEELFALFDARNIELPELEETPITNASYYGRIFGRVGGLTEAAEQAIKELNVQGFEFRPVVCSGMDECKQALNKLKGNRHDFNFIEGMACEGGCVNGPAVSIRSVRNKMAVDKFAKETEKESIKSAVEGLNANE